MERKDCGTCKFRKSDALGTGCGIIINQPKDCVAFSHYEPQSPSPKSENKQSCEDCKNYDGNNKTGCRIFVERYTNCGGFVDTTEDAICRGDLILEVDKKEPKSERTESVRDILANFFDGLYDAKRTLRKTLKDYDDLYEQAESRIRAIIEKEVRERVVDEFWQEICKLDWNGNVEVDDANVTVMELVDIRNKIMEGK